MLRRLKTLFRGYDDPDFIVRFVKRVKQREGFLGRNLEDKEISTLYRFYVRNGRELL